jgi:hypothetical protein
MHSPMKTARSRLLRPLVALGLVCALGLGAWVHRESTSTPLVNRSALRNYHVAAAAEAAEPAAAAHRTTSAGYAVWKDLKDEQKAILKPLEKRWDYLSANQRRSLLETARRHPRMTEEQKTRFNARLVQWSQLTGKERREMRERYKALIALPPQQQEQVRKSWFEDQAAPEAGEALLPTAFDDP